MKNVLVYILLFLSFTLTSFNCNSQKIKTDSLLSLLQESTDNLDQLRILNELTVQLRRSYPDSALYFAKQAENIAYQNNFKDDLAECYKNIGNIYNGKDNFQEASKYYQLSINIYREIGDSLGVAKNYNNLGALHRNRGNFALSLEYYQKSLELRKLKNDTLGLGVTYNNIGNIHYYQGNYDLAKEYYFKSLEIRKQFNNEMGMAGCYNNIGSIFIFNEDYNSGLKYFKQALTIYTKFEDKLGVGHTYKNIGNAYYKLEEFSLALDYFYNSLKIDKQLKNRLGIATSYNEIAKIYNALNNYTQAKKYAQKALEISKQTGGFLDRKNALEQLAIANEGLSDFEKALSYYKFFLNAKDSIFNIEKVKELESLESKYQLENKQLEIDKLESENELKTVKLEKMRIRIILILIVSIAFIIFIIELLIIRRKLKKKNATIYEQNEEISSQKDELERHRNHLEKLVEERTKDLELAKQRAEESDQLKSSFLANMSHEIRTPMNAIVGFSNLLVENEIDDETKANYKHEISSNCFTLLSLVDNILDLAKIETKQIHFNKKAFSLKDLLDDLYYSFLETAENKEIDLLFQDIIDNDVTLNTDNYRLKQILGNLLDNAIKFTDEGSVELSYTIYKENITFTVKDTGIGMNKNQIDNLFKGFSKFNKEKQKLYRGAGLGLAISYQLTILLGGKIQVESEPKKGSTFYIILPAVEILSEYGLSKSQKSHSRYNWKDKTLLIAEDDSSNFYYFKMLFSETKLKIIHAKNGNEAIQKTKDYSPDLILMDLKMPEIDGLKAVRAIRKDNTQVPIIAQTAFSMENDEQESLDAGCNAYITKPIQKHQLFRLLDKFLS
jgi:signal transduction histidine kinase/CheY-like chemotaxis protein